MAGLKSRFGSRHPRSPGLPAAIFRQLVLVHLRQGKPILFLVLPYTSMPPNLAHSLSFPGGEQRHTTESAAPLNPFIGTENRII
jgi:hypothetical protein